MGFVENGETGVATQFANTNIAHFAVTPGIELDNPSTAINNGNISIVSNWNLGAGTTPGDLLFRFNSEHCSDICEVSPALIETPIGYFLDYGAELV